MNIHVKPTARPIPFQGDLAKLPEALEPLKTLPNWVCWKWEWKVNKKGVGKWDKPPFDPARPRTYAKNNDPTTWGTYEQVLAVYQRGECDGMGFNLSGTDIAAFDIDDCRDPGTGEIAAEGMEIVERAASYTECTVSGTGLRVIGFGHGSREEKIHRKQKIPNSPVEVESYRSPERYIVVTGVPLAGTWPHIADIGYVMDDVVDELDGRHNSDGAFDFNTARKQHDSSGAELPTEEPGADGKPQLLLPLAVKHTTPVTSEENDTPTGEADDQRESSNNAGADTASLSRMTLPEELQRLIFNGPAPSDDHSRVFHHAVCWLGDLGWSATRIEPFIAGKPIVPERFYKRSAGLAGEIARCLRRAKRRQETGGGATGNGQDNSQPSITLTYFGEIGETARKQWVMKGVIAKGETSSWIAPPGKGKSALLTDIVIHVASATDWRGYLAKERCGVVYFALERADLVKRRLQAHARRDNLSDLPIAVAGQVIDLMSPACVAAIVSAIRAAEAKFGLGVGMIVIDTFAKGIAASGGDEDKAKDQNITLANLRRIQEQTGVHVAIIGHTGKDESRGARGSNAHVGDTDVMVQLRGDDIKTAEIVKANDQQEGVLTRFKLETFELGRGDAITTAIMSVETFDEAGAQAKGHPQLSPSERRAMELLERAIIDAGQPAPLSEEFPRGIGKVVSLEVWREYCQKGGLTSGESEGAFRKAFIRAHNSLAAKHRVGIWENLVWLAYN
jgi:AAA domain-containing protein